LRIGGKKAAIFTLCGDVLKGVIPVLLAKFLNLDIGSLALVAFAAFLGHLYPIFFEFKGGKGVATAFGCMIALSPLVGVLSLATWLVILFISRYSSLAALITALLAPLYAWYVSNPIYTGIIALMSVFLMYRHRQNISNLISGKESKMGKKS
jgi:glycerol-3-phosphate acyltransferase PlsY